MAPEAPKARDQATWDLSAPRLSFAISQSFLTSNGLAATPAPAHTIINPDLHSSQNQAESYCSRSMANTTDLKQRLRGFQTFPNGNRAPAGLHLSFFPAVYGVVFMMSAAKAERSAAMQPKSSFTKKPGKLGCKMDVSMAKPHPGINSFLIDE
ncbi:hypothetical protein DSO57_1023750 [Entomophthora muscae]|uniref:Uncharacterized protein n=1 Tax=Entomophthora muscae TaxID=34485 RepID=A0ACC2S4X6_9FUNG|nr:hypothetical protein DSO57_1023750 [Entomophthora muscae]